MKYRWNKKDILKKKRYVTERLKNCIDEKERKKLQIALISYVSMLNINSSIYYINVSKILDKITKGKCSLNKNKKYTELEQNLFNSMKSHMNEEYLTYLIQTAKNLAATKNNSEPILNPLNLNEENIVNISKDFYAKLNDDDISTYALKQLNNHNLINFYTNTHNIPEDYNGIHYYDPIFNVSYCGIKKTGTLFDIQAINHETMHAVDSSINNITILDEYYGFHEVPTYTIDYLLFDYLEQIGSNKNEIEKLRLTRNITIQNTALLSLRKIYSKLLHSKGLKVAHKFEIKDIIQCITNHELQLLFDIQSYVMAYGLYLQIFSNKEKGITNLKYFMQNNIPKNKIPDFTNIDLAQEAILQLSKELGQQLTFNKDINNYIK